MAEHCHPALLSDVSAIKVRPIWNLFFDAAFVAADQETDKILPRNVSAPTKPHG